jgi:type I restriction enzyme S subunit
MNVLEDRVDLGDVMQMDFSPSDFARYELKPGDILLNEGQSRELVGRPAMYRGELPGACFTNSLIRFQARETVNPEYALVVFLGYLKSGRFQEVAPLTVNIAHLGAERFAQMEFPLPPLMEQEEIVRRARRALGSITSVTQQVHSSLEKLRNLEASILTRAFRGELVPQDPADEPASVLLERIRAETTREGEAKPRRGRRAGRV